MVFSTFVKHAKAHSAAPKPQFFESSYPYLRNNHALVNFEAFFQKTAFGFGDPNPSSTSSDRFFGIDIGHYGVYFTIFNNEGDKRRIYPINYEGRSDELAGSSSHLPFKEPLTADQWVSFFISKVSRETFENANSMHLISKRFLSPSHPLQPSHLIFCKRFFTTKSKATQKQSNHDLLLNLKALEVEQINESKFESEQNIDTFESDLISCQTSKILKIHNNAVTAEELNNIFPIYQSLKRNHIHKLDIEVYHAVLLSIIHRSCDNSIRPTINEIESKLSNLLTVYQDLLTSSLIPTTETYNIVLGGLFQGCKESINIIFDPESPQNLANDAFLKSQEFIQISTDLFQSIQSSHYDEKTLINMLTCMCVHPSIISNNLFEKVMNNQVNHPIYYISLLSCIPYLKNKSPDASYKLVEEIYSNYTSSFNKQEPTEIAAEYPLYSSIVQCLIKTGNIPHATKFVDEILKEYIQVKDIDANHINKYDISLLASTYFKTLSEVDLPKALEGLNAFNKSPLIPEFSIEMYNSIINKLVTEFRQTSDQETYSLIWKLLSYIAVRKDYHEIGIENINDFELPLRSYNETNAREELLSLSIDIGDHERVFLIVKELLLKNHMIKQFNVFRKLLSYLHNGSYYEPNKINKYYFELMWNIIETQSIHYQKFNQLNYYLSGVVQFINTKVQDNQSINMILNSPFIRQTFQNFRLEGDNIYGVMNVTKDLMNAKLGNDVAKLYRSIELQSFILNELEETESYYFEISDEISQFKNVLKDSFSTIINQTHDRISFSEEIIQACRSINIDLLSEIPQSVVGYPSRLNLSFQLNVNYSNGLDKFIDAFRKGYTFTFETWKLVLNSQFASEILQYNDKVKISALIERIHLLSLGTTHTNKLLVQLITLNNEPVNIKYLQVLLNSDVMSDDALVNILRFWKTTENVYLLKLIKENFEGNLLSKSKNQNLVINEYMKALTAHNEFDTIIEFFKSNESNMALNIKANNDLQIVQSILNSFIEMRDLEQFDKLYRQYFSLTQKSSSPIVLNLLIKYATFKGLYNVVLNKLSKKVDSPCESRELIYFNQFIKSLSGENLSMLTEEAKGGLSVKEFSYQLISMNNTEDMKKLYLSNSKFVKHNIDEIILTSFDAFSIAATIVKPSVVLSKRFQTLLGFLKLMKLDTLNINHLISLIKLYSSMEREDLINILLNKIVYPNENGQYNISPILDFYFFEIPIIKSSRSELAKVFKEFQIVFERIKDIANINIIQDLCLQYKIPINDQTVGH